MSKDKHGSRQDVYKSNNRISIGAKDAAIADTDLEMTQTPKIHTNITVSGMNSVITKIVEMLQAKVPGPVTVEFKTKVRDVMADAPPVFTFSCKYSCCWC